MGFLESDPENKGGTESWRDAFESIYGNSDSGGSGDNTTVWEFLVKFAKNPSGIIVGVIIAWLLDVLETIVLAVLDSIIFVFEGSTVGSTAGKWGLADVPRYLFGLILDMGDTAGTTILDAITGINQPILEAVAMTGPVAPVLGAVIIVAEIVVGVILVERVVSALLAGVADLDPTGITTAVLTLLGGDPN